MASEDQSQRKQRPLRRPRNERGPRAARTLLPAVLLLANLLASCAYWQGRGEADPYASRVQSIVAGSRFDVVRWELHAAEGALADRLRFGQPNPLADDTSQRVLDYLNRAQRIGEIERQIEGAAAGAPLQADRDPPLPDSEAELAALRDLQEEERPYVERALEAQVSLLIGEEGLGWLGGPLPPPTFRFTEPPNYLVISPRDHIDLRLGLSLVPRLALEQRERLEQRLEAELPNTSAMVTSTGGFPSWPTMIADQAGVDWILATIAHEWTHLYLVAFPLGMHYYDDQDVTAMNETLAQIVGDELGARALHRFYPQRAAGGLSTEAQSRRLAQQSSFDFNEEMRLTRERVDSLLAEGKVEEAEAYMEQRRQEFVAGGYYIRRLNQAYFAFHGSYRTGPAAPSEDPVAPRLQRLRRESANLAAFLVAARRLRRLEDLVALVPMP